MAFVDYPVPTPRDAVSGDYNLPATDLTGEGVEHFRIDFDLISGASNGYVWWQQNFYDDEHIDGEPLESRYNYYFYYPDAIPVDGPGHYSIEAPYLPDGLTSDYYTIDEALRRLAVGGLCDGELSAVGGLEVQNVSVVFYKHGPEEPLPLDPIPPITVTEGEPIDIGVSVGGGIGVGTGNEGQPGQQDLSGSDNNSGGFTGDSGGPGDNADPDDLGGDGVYDGPGDTTIEVDGLPPGTGWNEEDGSIEGTPTQPGEYEVEIEIRDPGGVVIDAVVIVIVVLPELIVGNTRGGRVWFT